MRITIMGSSDNNFSKKYSKLAYTLGRELSRSGHIIVTGGYDGIMKDVCRGASPSKGAKVEGVVSPEFYDLCSNKYITKKVEKPNISSRLYYMIHKSPAIVVFPGSIGTITELWMSIYFNNVTPKKIKIFVHADWHKLLNQSISQLALYGNYNIDLIFFSDVDTILKNI